MAIASFGMNIIESPFLNPLNATQLPWEVCTLNQRVKKIASAVLPLTVAFVVANSLGGSIVAYLGVLTINALVSKVSNSIFYKSENLNIGEIQRRKSITLNRDKIISMLNRGIKDFRYYNFTAADLRGANLTGADLRWADLRGANLTGADLRWAYLRKANLTEVNLRGANLTGADLTEAELNEASLTEANLTGANLTGANLTGAYLWQADLSGANLTEVNLRGAKLSRATLTGADLRGAKLTMTTLWEANLTGATLTDVDLSKAILANTHITAEQYETIEKELLVTGKSREEIQELFVIEELVSA